MLLLTCEHASNAIPPRYRSLFSRASAVLASHRGWDPGSLQLGKRLQRRLNAPLFQTSFSRLLVEPNRSLWHPNLFSEFTRELDEASKANILQRYYFPHRHRVEQWIAQAQDADESVLHISVHSFTPVFHGQVRNADIGLLYDPRRSTEKHLADSWHAELRARIPNWRVRRNYPYLGRADGLTTHLRRIFGPEKYQGIELEVNQGLLQTTETWHRMAEDLATSLERVITQ